MDPMSTLFDIIVQALRKEATSPVARYLRTALVGYYGGLFGAPIGAYLASRSVFALGIARTGDGLAFLVALILGSILGFLGGSPLGSLLARFILRQRSAVAKDGWLIVGGFLGGFSLAAIVSAAGLLA